MTATVPTPAPEEHAIGIAGLAAMLGVSPDTAYHRARSGELPGFRVGRMWRFWPSEIRKAVAKASAPADPWAMPAASRRARRAR